MSSLEYSLRCASSEVILRIFFWFGWNFKSVNKKLVDRQLKNFKFIEKPL